MRVLFSLTYYTPYISGLTLYVKRLAEALVRKGYQLSVISYQYDKKLKKEEIINRVRVIRAKPLFKISKGFFSFDWIVKSWQEVKKCDVVIVNLPQFEGVAPALLGKILGKRVVSIYHCEVDLPSGLLNILVERLLHLSHMVTLSISDRVITYTKDFADQTKLLPSFGAKLQYIYPPIIKPKVDKRVQNIIKEKIGEKPDFVIGVAARLATEKGIEYLFEALPQIKCKMQNAKCKNKNIKIVIAGSMDPVGEESYKRKILSLVEKYKEYIIFLGELKEEEMGPFYSLIDVLVLPSINSTEAFGMVQVEAMMTGVPVVASNLAGVRIPIQKTGMGLIVPIKNSKKLAEAIVEILLNKKKYIKSKETIKKEFSFAKTVDCYEKLLVEEVQCL